jgi:hypothetical protein
MAQVVGNSDSGWAVWGGSNSGTGVVGTAGTGVGTFGQSTNSYGVWGRSSNSAGVVGDTTAFESPAVWGNARGRGPGVVGTAGGVSRAGVFGHHTQAGIYGVGVHGKVSYPPAWDFACHRHRRERRRPRQVHRRGGPERDGLRRLWR